MTAVASVVVARVHPAYHNIRRDSILRRAVIDKDLIQGWGIFEIRYSTLPQMMSWRHGDRPKDTTKANASSLLRLTSINLGAHEREIDC